jgi:VWFA-related protein
VSSQRTFGFKYLMRVVLAVVSLALIAETAVAQTAPEPPEGTIAARMKQAKEAAQSYGGQIEITAVNTPLVALDKQGHAVLDLRPEEIQVLEDGQRVKLLDLVPGLAPEQRPPSQGVHATTITGASVPGSDGDDRGSWRPWRVVFYVSTELAGRYVLRSACEDAAREAGRLTDLGPVEVVLADPMPTVIANVGTDSQRLQAALDDVASRASGVTRVERIRSDFVNEFRPGFGFDSLYDVGQPAPAAMAARARAAANKERTIVLSELDRIVGWIQGEPPTARGLLVWVTGGFDLNPADFYLPLLQQLDPVFAQSMRTEYQTLSLEKNVRDLVEVALSYGWTVMPVNASKTTFLHGADIDGSGKAQQMSGVSVNSIDAQAGDFRQVAPTYPLRVIAAGTGGELVLNENQLETALDHTKAAYLVTYQVDRPADGRLHRLEIRCTRPGLRLLGRGFAPSGSLRGVSATRARRLLAGEPIEGSLPVAAEVKNITKAKKGQRLGELEVVTDIGDLRQVLSPLGLGRMRVTVVVEIEDGAAFVNHQEMDLVWSEVGNRWVFSASLKWPKRATRLAVVVEELVSSTWGAEIVSLRGAVKATS